MRWAVLQPLWLLLYCSSQFIYSLSIQFTFILKWNYLGLFTLFSNTLLNFVLFHPITKKYTFLFVHFLFFVNAPGWNLDPFSVFYITCSLSMFLLTLSITLFITYLECMLFSIEFPSVSDSHNACHVLMFPEIQWILNQLSIPSSQHIQPGQ